LFQHEPVPSGFRGNSRVSFKAHHNRLMRAGDENTARASSSAVAARRW
jgi:hypothetical protein